MPSSSNASKTLNAFAPEYHPKTPVATTQPPPHLFHSPIPPPPFSASAHHFLPPPPPVFPSTTEFYLPIPPYAQPHFHDISSRYYYVPTGTPIIAHQFPPQAAATIGSSPPQARKTKSPDDGDFRPGERRGCLGNPVMSLKLDEDNTTVMLKNIPYDCPREYLFELLDGFCGKCGNESSSYDFFYLPVDFKTQKGRGFAFINFTTAAAALKFFDSFDSTEWDPLRWFRWPKKMEVARAKIQGKEALETHFSNSTFECETDDFLPVYFSPPRDGRRDHVEMTSVGRRRRAILRPEAPLNHAPAASGTSIFCSATDPPSHI